MARLGTIERRRLGSDRKKVYVFLTAKGRALKKRLVPLAEAVNSIAVQGVPPAQIAGTRAVLLTNIENLAREEAVAALRMPSTRELARLPAPRKRPARR